LLLLVPSVQNPSYATATLKPSFGDVTRSKHSATKTTTDVQAELLVGE